MRGVRIVGWPYAPTSPYPRSSQSTMTTFGGRAGAVAATAAPMRSANPESAMMRKIYLLGSASGHVLSSMEDRGEAASGAPRAREVLGGAERRWQMARPLLEERLAARLLEVVGVIALTREPRLAVTFFQSISQQGPSLVPPAQPAAR